MTREIDLIEEIARSHGYDAFPADLGPYRPGTVPDHPLFQLEDELRHALVARGLFEAQTPAFVPEGEGDVRVSNPLNTQEPYVRRGRPAFATAPGGAQLQPRAPGTCASSRSPRRSGRRVRAKRRWRRPTSRWRSPGARDAPHWSDAGAGPGRLGPQGAPRGGGVAARTGVSRDRRSGERRRGALRPRPGVRRARRRGRRDRDEGGACSDGVVDAPRVGRAGVGHGDEAAGRGRRRWFLSLYRPLPQYPAVERDLALLVRDEVPADTVLDAVRTASRSRSWRRSWCSTCIGVKASPAGTRSVAIRLRFRAPERTLKDKEVDRVVQGVLARLKEELGVEARG